MPRRGRVNCKVLSCTGALFVDHQFVRNIGEDTRVISKFLRWALTSQSGDHRYHKPATVHANSIKMKFASVILFFVLALSSHEVVADGKLRGQTRELAVGHTTAPAGKGHKGKGESSAAKGGKGGSPYAPSPGKGGKGASPDPPSSGKGGEVDPPSSGKGGEVDAPSSGKGGEEDDYDDASTSSSKGKGSKSAKSKKEKKQGASSKEAKKISKNSSDKGKGKGDSKGEGKGSSDGSSGKGGASKGGPESEPEAEFSHGGGKGMSAPGKGASKGSSDKTVKADGYRR